MGSFSLSNYLVHQKKNPWSLTISVTQSKIIKRKFYNFVFQISSVQIHNKAMGANIAIAGAMGTTAKTMGSINKVMNPQQIAKDMEAFKVASAKMDMTDEMSKWKNSIRLLCNSLDYLLEIIWIRMGSVD